MTEKTYSPGVVCRIADISQYTLHTWIRRTLGGLIDAQAQGQGRARRFTIRDVVAITCWARLSETVSLDRALEIVGHIFKHRAPTYLAQKETDEYLAIVRDDIGWGYEAGPHSVVLRPRGSVQILIAVNLSALTRDVLAKLQAADESDRKNPSVESKDE